MSGAAVLTTARLRLRPVALADVDELHRMWTDREVRRYLMDGRVMSRQWTVDTVLESAREFADAGLGLWLVTRRQVTDAIGFCGLRADAPDDEVALLYGIATDFWGQGLAGEAARAMLAYGFGQLQLPRIVAGVDAPNAASLRVLDKLGMQYERSRPGSFGRVRWYALAYEDFVGSGEAGRTDG